MRASASRAALLLQCAWPFGPEAAAALRNTTGDGKSRVGALWGTAFHKMMEVREGPGGSEKKVEAKAKKIIEDVDVPGNVDDLTIELTTHVSRSHAVLEQWLVGKNPWKIVFAEKSEITLESSNALSLGGDGQIAARSIAHPTVEDHVYEEASDSELPGTYDLSCRSLTDKFLLVMDYKTGEYEDHSRPAENPQLLCLLLMAWLRLPVTSRKKTKLYVAVLHARRRGLPGIYAGEVSVDDLLTFGIELQHAFQRIGDGSMRPGPWCSALYCSARGVCPTKDAELLARGESTLRGLLAAAPVDPGNLIPITALARRPAVDGMTKSERLGVLYDTVQQAEKLAVRCREEIRNEVLAGALVEMPNSKGFLKTRAFVRENLSKSSIVRAYGEARALKMFEKLRKDGAIEPSEVTQLFVEPERGK